MARLRTRGPFPGGSLPPRRPCASAAPVVPGRTANRLADRALLHLRLVRTGRKTCPDTTPESVRLAIFPARAGASSCASRTTVPGVRERAR